jgi:ribonuclease Z
MTSSKKSGGLKFLETDHFYLEAEKMKHGIPTNAYSFVKKGKLRIDKTKLKKSKLPFGPLLQKIKAGKNVSYKGKKYLAKNLTYLADSKKVSVVLDTVVNDKIAKFVKDADVFVCESSFNSSNAKEAKAHLHLTGEQAAKIAKKAKVKKLFLTHISQRYDSNLKKFLGEAKKIFKNSELAKDFLAVDLE